MNYELSMMKKLARRKRYLLKSVAHDTYDTADTFRPPLYRGVTMVELLLVMGMIAIIFSFTTLNIINVRDTASLTTTVTAVVADIRQQQLKAMIGDTDGNGVRSPYGIYFTSSGYTVFPGITYSAANTKNFSVSLDPSLQFSQTFTGSTLVFASGSGEFANYDPAHDTLILRVTATGEQKQIEFNRYGTVTSVQ